MQNGLLAGEKAQDPCRTHGLAEHRGDGRAPHAQPKPEDQDGIQDDVDDRTDDSREHTGLGKALGRDEGVHAQHQQYEYRTQNVDAAVAQRIRQGHITGAEQPQQGGCPGIKPDGQHHGKQHQHGEAVGDDLLRLLFVALPQRNGGAGRAACTDQHGKGIQQHQDGREQSHAGQCCCADAGDMPDVNAVYDVVQQVDHLRHHCWDHQLQHQLSDAAGPHVLSCLRHGKKNSFLLQI